MSTKTINVIKKRHEIMMPIRKFNSLRTNGLKDKDDNIQKKHCSQRKLLLDKNFNDNNYMLPIK